MAIGMFVVGLLVYLIGNHYRSRLKVKVSGIDLWEQANQLPVRWFSRPGLYDKRSFAMIDYGYTAIEAIPEAMEPWGLDLSIASETKFGKYSLVGCEQATIEMHHQVVVLDESGRPMPGVCVVFGFDTGNDYAAKPRGNYWTGSPHNLRGNVQFTDTAGYAQHTYGQGGEDVFIWDVEDDGVLRLSADIVGSCHWVNEQHGRFQHTGVRLTFQRRKVGIVPEQQRMNVLEEQVADLANQLADLRAIVQEMRDEG